MQTDSRQPKTVTEALAQGALAALTGSGHVKLGQKWIENDNRFYRVVTMTKIGEGEKAGKVQMNNSNRCWVSIARLSTPRAGYSLAKRCPDCTQSRQNCPTCKATGWVKVSGQNK